jgi:hypothetical protein
MAVGMIGRTHWSAIITYRGATIRIISVRRSTPSEIHPRSTRMKKTQAEPTTAKNLERKFERSEDVLDYFDVQNARVVGSRSSASGMKSKSSGKYSVKRSSGQSAVVHEKAGGYRNKK